MTFQPSELYIEKFFIISLAKIGSEILERMLWIWFSSVWICEKFVRNLANEFDWIIHYLAIASIGEGHHFAIEYTVTQVCFVLSLNTIDQVVLDNF